MQHEYSCPHCGTISKFELEPYDPGNTSGLPDNWYPPEGGIVDGPDNCPNCQFKFNFDTILSELEPDPPDGPDFDYDYESDH